MLLVVHCLWSVSVVCALLLPTSYPRFLTPDPCLLTPVFCLLYFYPLHLDMESNIHKHIGAWRRLVAHLLWEQGVGGSNPLAPTSIFEYLTDGQI
jgi:hypothetical protein